MPAFVFATRAMYEAALPLLDDLAEPITVLRNPTPNDPRPVHVLSERHLARLRPQFAAAGIEIEPVLKERSGRDNDALAVVERN